MTSTEVHKDKRTTRTWYPGFKDHGYEIIIESESKERGPVPYLGGAPLHKLTADPNYNKYVGLTRQNTDLWGFFKNLRENCTLPERFNPQTIKMMIDYFEANQKNFEANQTKEKAKTREASAAIDHLESLIDDPKYSVLQLKHSKRLTSAFNSLTRPTPEQQKVFYNQFLESIAVGDCKNAYKRKEARVESEEKEEDGLPVVGVLPLVWAMELCSRSFLKNNDIKAKNNDGIDFPGYPLNYHPEVALMDYAWGARLIEAIFGKNNGIIHPEQVTPLGMYGFGAMYQRFGLKEEIKDPHFEENYPEKLKRVGMYAAISKSLFLLKEKELVEEYILPEFSERVIIQWRDLEAIIKYPEFIKKLGTAATTSETYLAEKITEITPYLDWYRRNADKFTPTHSHWGVELGQPFNNALAYETKYDGRFIIPGEGQNGFVKKVMDDMAKKIKSMVGPERWWKAQRDSKKPHEPNYYRLGLENKDEKKPGHILR